MAYTQILNIGRGRGVRGMVCVTKRDITFTYLFKKKIAVEKHVGLYTNDDGFLCFKFFKEYEEGLYTVSTGTGNMRFLRIPTFLKGALPTGRFNITEAEDGFIVTDCKISLNN